VLDTVGSFSGTVADISGNISGVLSNVGSSFDPSLDGISNAQSVLDGLRGTTGK